VVCATIGALENIQDVWFQQDVTSMRSLHILHAKKHKKYQLLRSLPLTEGPNFTVKFFTLISAICFPSLRYTNFKIPTAPFSHEVSSVLSDLRPQRR
jgi:hypothetical protein